MRTLGALGRTLVILLGIVSTAHAEDPRPRVYLYGGPGSLEGTFQSAGGSPDWQGWTSYDATEPPASELWQVSEFNAQNLGGHGPGNRAMWCGGDPPGWVSGPGYGNFWDARLEWRSGPIADSSLSQDVSLDFFFNIDTEAADRFEVRYWKGGGWRQSMSTSGTNAIASVFAAPGDSYATHAPYPIHFDGNDYFPGENGAEIRLQLLFRSDDAESDEDGLFDSVAGAVQVDDIRVQWLDGGQPRESFTDFEGSGPFAWFWNPLPAAGDFTKILQNLKDLDPCRENPTPQMTFIDNGTPPKNVPGQTTGATFDPLINWGVPGYVVPYDGGLTADTPEPRALDCRPVSPIIALDAPGPADDGPGWAVYLGYERYYHGALISPDLFSVIRVSEDGGSTWGDWQVINNFVYFAPSPYGYYDETQNISSFLTPASTHVQFEFQIYPYLDFGLSPPTNIAGPWFDNVQVYKILSGDEADVQWYDDPTSSFPRDTSFDLSSSAGRDLLDIPIDSPGLNPPPSGALHDTFFVHVAPLNPAATVLPQNVRMVWVLDRNPVFEDAIRAMPGGTTNSVGTSRSGWDQWFGSFPARSTGVSWDPNLFTVDPQDVDFMYPGDELRWYIEVTSQDGIVSTFPVDLSGFQDGRNYDARRTIRGLPTALDNAGTTPSILLIRGSTAADRDQTLELALQQLGLELGRDADLLNMTYRPESLSMTNPDEIGPSPAQMAGYRHVIVLEPRIFTAEDAQEFLPFLENWQDLPGDRTVILFSQRYLTYIASHRPSFLQRMGVQVGSSFTPRDDLGTSAPTITPQLPGLTETVFMLPPCGIQWIPGIQALPGASVGHLFHGPAGASGPTFPASVFRSWVDSTGSTKTAITLPWTLEQLSPHRLKATNLLEEARILGDLLQYTGAAVGGTPTPSPVASAPGIARLSAAPNPFNPTTTLSFDLGESGHVRAVIFDLRGRRVRVLQNGRMAAGERRLEWDGRDDSGRSTASGVYIVRVESAGVQQQIKVVLLE